MKDNNKNDYSEIPENNIKNAELPKEEAKLNVENNKDGYEGTQEMQEELSTEAQTNESQEANAALEAEVAEKKGSDNKESLHNDGVSEAAEYVWNSDASSTYHFKPENMREAVGRRSSESFRYSYSQPSYSLGESKDKKEHKRGKKTVFVVLVAVLVALALAVGGTAGYFVNGLISEGFDDNNSEVGKADTIHMTKNDSPIEVKIEQGSTGYVNLSRSEVVELVADAVVEITTSKVQTNSFFGGNYVTSGAGSGVVIAQNDEYAYVATNYHVIDGATAVRVTLTDKTVVEAEYLDGDASNDIAMLRIKTDKVFPKIVCGSSDSLKVGADVVAIGNPLGSLGGTVTEGIISALDREISIEGTTMKLIQTSAAVNPGNSGGGLFNMAGELIGIVNAKQSAEGIEGLGFAIPIDSVYDMLVEIIETKYIHGRPTLGIEAEYVTDSWTAYMKYGVRTSGVFVTSSNNDALMAKDLIRSIDGQLVTDSSSYAVAMSSLTVGEKVTVEVYRNARLTNVELEVIEYVPSGIFG